MPARIVRTAASGASPPRLSVTAIETGSLLGGNMIVETVFAWPGIGRMLVDAISARDLPLVQGSVLFIAVMFIVVNLLVDVSYALLNPKVRYD